MPIRESKSAITGLLLATGGGAILGVQGCWLAEYGFGAPIPWYGQAWILLSHVFLGLSIGATAGLACWWKRGTLLGLLAAIPSAFGAVALGLRWTPYGVAGLTEGIAVGLLLAFLADALHPSSTRRYNPSHADSEECVSYAMYQRLAEEKACLEHLDAEREYPGNADFGRTTEDRILWKELLDLELQDIDEQVASKEALMRVGQALSPALSPARRSLR